MNWFKVKWHSFRNRKSELELDLDRSLAERKGNRAIYRFLERSAAARKGWQKRRAG